MRRTPALGWASTLDAQGVPSECAVKRPAAASTLLRASGAFMFAMCLTMSRSVTPLHSPSGCEQECEIGGVEAQHMYEIDA